MTVSLCKFCYDGGDERNERLHASVVDLESLLPRGFHHKICTHEPNSKSVLRMKLRTEEEIEQWLEAFQESSTLTWRKSKTYPDAGRFNQYRVDMRCQHNTRVKSASGAPTKGAKNTGCPATMYLVLKRATISRDRKSKSSDPHHKEGLFFSISLQNEHNHHVSCADAWRKRDVSEDTVEKLKALFESGHSPSSALDTLKYDLQEKHGDKYVFASADRSICPDLQFCYRLYYKIFQKNYGATSGEKMFLDLERRIHEYNEEKHETCASVKTTADDQTIIAICTPLMKRVHTMVEHSGEMIFVDSSGNCDGHKSRIFVLLTHSTAGELPLGVLITSSESQGTITAGFELLKTLLPDGCFFGRNSRGPRVAITDDCLSLRQALHAVYPETSLIFCVFHLLQAMWCWLWDGHNGIAKQDRPHLLETLKQLVYAETTTDLCAIYDAVGGDQIAQKYPKFRDHLASVYETRHEWAICLRSDLPTLGNNTNNFIESAMKVVKDKVLFQLKAYNVTQLVDFMMTRMESYYVRRLTDVANNRMGNILQSKYFMRDNDVNCDNIVKEDESNYTVPSKTTGKVYHVNIDIGTCTCPVGTTGGPCKHQHAVMKTCNIQSANFLPTNSPHLRKMYYAIATGRDDVDDAWFGSLECQEDIDLPEHSEPVPGGCDEVQDPRSMRLESLSVQRDAENNFHTRGESRSSRTQNEDVEKKLNNMFEVLREKLKTNSKMYAIPLKSFIFQFEKMETDSALISSLRTYGQYSGAATVARRVKITSRKYPY